jgi:hypothetical protein
VRKIIQKWNWKHLVWDGSAIQAFT